MILQSHEDHSGHSKGAAEKRFKATWVSKVIVEQGYQSIDKNGRQIRIFSS